DAGHGLGARPRADRERPVHRIRLSVLGRLPRPRPQLPLPIHRRQGPGVECARRPGGELLMIALKQSWRVLEQLWLPALLVIWWWVASASSTNPFLPPLSEIVDAFIAALQSGSLAANTFASMRNIFVGLIVGVGLGIAIGTAVGLSRAARSVLDPYL